MALCFKRTITKQKKKTRTWFSNLSVDFDSLEWLCYNIVVSGLGIWLSMIWYTNTRTWVWFLHYGKELGALVHSANPNTENWGPQEDLWGLLTASFPHWWLLRNNTWGWTLASACAHTCCAQYLCTHTNMQVQRKYRHLIYILK